MRIVVVTTSYPATPGDASGHFVRSHARALAGAHGAEVVVISPGRPSDAEVEAAGAGHVRVVRTGGAALFAWPGAVARARERPARLVLAPAALARAAWVVRRERPFDRAVAHWMVPSAFPVLAGVAAPLEVVAHGADVRLLAALPAVARAMLIARVLERAERVRFVAASLRDDLVRTLPPALGGRLLRAAVIEPLPIEVPARDALGDPRPGLGLAPGVPYVAWVGRVVAAKRPHLAIEAARSAGLPLVLIGDGPALGEVRAATHARPAGQVVLGGLLPRDRALAVIGGAAALLHTSEAEGAPTVVREARALGVPVVACAAGDLAAWAATDGGIVVAPADGGALGEALRKVTMATKEAA